jgi:hypothetical protein
LRLVMVSIDLRKYVLTLAAGFLKARSPNPVAVPEPMPEIAGKSIAFEIGKCRSTTDDSDLILVPEPEKEPTDCESIYGIRKGSVYWLPC